MKINTNATRYNFKSLIIDLINEFDPKGIVTDELKKEKGMEFYKYLDEKNEEFIKAIKISGE